MKYQVFYKPSAAKELNELPKKFQKKAIEAVNALENGDFFKTEKMRGTPNFYRSKRAWPYRILFTIEGTIIRVIAIAHRQGVYK